MAELLDEKHLQTYANVGIIIKDYNYIANSIRKDYGVKQYTGSHTLGVGPGTILNPYDYEHVVPRYVSDYQRSNSFDYVDYIRRVYSDRPSFDISMYLGSYTIGDKPFTFPKSLESPYILDDTHKGITNYNIQSPITNDNGKSDTLLANMSTVYRNKGLRTAFAEWDNTGTFGENYDPISMRMSRYYFNDVNYGNGLDLNTRGAGENINREYIDTIVGPLDYAKEASDNNNGLLPIDAFNADYYNDLGWRSKDFVYRTMYNVFNTLSEDDDKFAHSIKPGITPSDTYFPVGRSLYNSPLTNIYPSTTDGNVSTVGLGDMDYRERSIRFVFNYGNKIKDRHYNYQYLEYEGSGDDYDGHYDTVSSNEDGVNNSSERNRNKGTANGVYVGYDEKNKYNDLVNKTNRAFLHGKYDSLVSRFHTSTEDGRTPQQIQTALSVNYGLSHGRNLLKADVDKDTNTNGYDNPYCRVWTYHHEYHTIVDTIRPFSNRTKNTDNDDDTAEISASGSLFKDKEGEIYPFRRKDGVGGMKGPDSLAKYSVLNQNNGLVNITPTSNSNANLNVDIKHCMFSIENLAWRDYYKSNLLSDEQKGPLGGRIMWFPPYGLSFNESVSVQWGGQDFIGRGEQLYTYKNTERTGNLDFILLIDHPTIIDHIDKDRQQFYGNQKDANVKADSVDDTGSTEQTLLRFFAGCDILRPNKAQKETVVEPVKKETPEDSPAKNESPHVLEFSVFYPNNYTGYYDIKSNEQPYGTFFPIMYLANGIGTGYGLQFDNDSSASSYDYHDILVRFSDKITVNDISSWGTDPHYRGYNADVDETISGLPYDKVAPVTSDTFGYEMVLDNQDTLSASYPNPNHGVSRVSDHWNRYYTYDTNKMTDSFLAVNIDSKSTDSASTNGNWYICTFNERLSAKESESKALKDRIQWLYRIDTNVKKKKLKSYDYVNEAGDEELWRNEKLVNFKDYADIRSYGLNSQQGLGTVADKVFPNEFGASSANTTGLYVSEDGKKRLVSYADFVMAIYQYCPFETDKNISDYNIKEGIHYKQENVDLFKKIFGMKNVKIEIEGISNEHGHPKTARKKTESSNQQLAKHRALTMSTFIKELMEKNKILDSAEITTKSTPSKEVGDKKQVDVSHLMAKINRSAVIRITYDDVDDDDTTKKATDLNTAKSETTGTSNSILATMDGRGKEVQSAQKTDNSKKTKENDNNEKAEQTAADVTNTTGAVTTHRYETEADYFRNLGITDPVMHNKIVDKIKYFDPAFHSMSPEGFNARLSFLHQCTRQGPTDSVSDGNEMGENSANMAFGRPPVCVLRIGDFYYTKIYITSLGINYDVGGGIQWDMNPEGAGVQPMYAKINIGFKFTGGSDLGGPISRLQNALSFNYYANQRVYDDRSEMIGYTKDTDGKEFTFVPNIYQ